LESSSLLPETKPAWTATCLRVVLTVILPVVLVLTGVRLVMTEAFVRFEYHRPGFPADRYGFTQQDRLNYAPYTVRYLLQNKDISYLSDLTFDNGSPLFEDSELQHMEDVQTVARAALMVHTILSLVLAGIIVALARRRDTRPALRQGLFQGSILTILVMITASVVVLASWDMAFEDFHRIFFKGDSWLFSTSDTLIRLFPQLFWFDATLGGSVVIMLGMWYWEQRHK
jgi:integral membrane protein (TIGR01906 family)